jgi:murein DD-endopeptidase MepM/ murein hydrolase activator NlpD
MAKSRLSECNRPKRMLSLSCLGLTEIRAGSTVPVVIEELGDISLAQRLLAESVKHKFTPNSHTMDIDFSVLWEGDDYYGVQQRQFKEYDPSSAAADETDLKGGAATNAASGYRHPFHNGYVITASFGQKGEHWKKYHTGTDYVGSNKRVYAVGSGQVYSVGYDDIYGNHVLIQHYDGYYSLYAHLSSVFVSAKESVDTNTQIGIEGATGNVTGSHLHLEILRYPGQYPADIDPEDFLNSNY